MAPNRTDSKCLFTTPETRICLAPLVPTRLSTNPPTHWLQWSLCLFLQAHSHLQASAAWMPFARKSPSKWSPPPLGSTQKCYSPDVSSRTTSPVHFIFQAALSQQVLYEVVFTCSIRVSSSTSLQSPDPALAPILIYSFYTSYFLSTRLCPPHVLKSKQQTNKPSKD